MSWIGWTLPYFKCFSLKKLLSAWIYSFIVQFLNARIFLFPFLNFFTLQFKFYDSIYSVHLFGHRYSFFFWLITFSFVHCLKQLLGFDFNASYFVFPKCVFVLLLLARIKNKLFSYVKPEIKNHYKNLSKPKYFQLIVFTNSTEWILWQKLIFL